MGQFLVMVYMVGDVVDVVCVVFILVFFVGGFGVVVLLVDGVVNVWL